MPYNKGKKNIYTCRKCPCKIVTIDRDEGVTPFATMCVSKNCNGFMESSFYSVNQDLVPEYEWYQLENWKNSTNEHVRNGGLLLRKIASPKTELDELKQRYLELLHAVQTGISYLMTKNPKMVEPKHLRVGIDSAHVSNAAIINLLIEKGIFTELEYMQALCKATETEVSNLEKQLETFFETKVTLK